MARRYNNERKTEQSRLMAKLERLYVSPLGETYIDALTIEAWIKNRSISMEAQSLLCSALMKRAGYRDAILEELARKRGISVDALKDQILTGRAEILTGDEYAGVVDSRDE